MEKLQPSIEWKKRYEAAQESAITGNHAKCFDMKEIQARRYSFWIWVKLNFLTGDILVRDPLYG